MHLNTQAELEEKQIARERESLQSGIEKFRRQTNLGSFQRKFLDEFLTPLTEAIGFRKSEIGEQRSKAKLSDFVLAAIGEQELALITLVTVIHCIAESQQYRDGESDPEGCTLRRASMRIGDGCMNHFFAEIDSDVGDGSVAAQLECRLRAALLGRQTNKYNAVSRADKTIEAMKDSDWWSLGRRLSVGGELIHLAMEVTGLFEKSYQALGLDYEKKTAVISLSRLGVDWLETRREERLTGLEDAGILTIPVNLPMLSEPRPWTSLREGGYLTFSEPLIKRNDENFVDTDSYDLERMPAVTSAVHTLQKTAWRINRRIFDVYKTCWDDATLREKLLGVAEASEQVAAIEARIAACQTLQNEVFYFPYQLDFRGRIYPIPQILHNQGDDATRSLLEFARSEAVTTDSEYWTAIHTANCYGLSYLSLEERYQWCQDHKEEIREASADPIRHSTFWSTADEPFAFLAACFEWTAILDGANKTRLPIYVDGKCNGLQHLSAMSRDEHAGEAVNIVPSSKPMDIYDKVAQRVEQLLAEDDNNQAKFWRGKVDRTTVKKPVMTTPYGVTAEGMKQQIKSVTKSHNPNNAEISYLRDQVSEAIEEVMKGPAQVKSWLQKVTKIIAKNNKSLIWTTPSGFKVIQDYRKPLCKRLSAAGFSITYYLPVDADRPINKRKQELGIIANFVHSLDAAHLVHTVNTLDESGVDSIAVIHDCFGVHARYVPEMNKIIRDQFVRIYSKPILAQFIDEQARRTNLDLPYFENFGQLDIGQVMESSYFFS